MAEKKQLSEEMLKYLVANALKKDKLVVTSARGDGDSIHFEAVSESKMVSVSGTFADPQQELELESEEPQGDH